MEPITFRPTEETRKILDSVSEARPGVPRSYIINEAIIAGLGDKQAKKSKRQESQPATR